MSDENASTQITGTWIIVPNYDMASRMPSCSLTNTVKRSGDIGVFRPALPIGWVDHEGAFDVSQLAIEEGATVLGWKSPEQVDEELASLKTQLISARNSYARECSKPKRLEAQVEELQGNQS